MARARIFKSGNSQAVRLPREIAYKDPEIELMLLDINMPVMDGLTLLSVLQERESPVRAVIVSAYGDMPNIRTAMNRGAFDFVTKPVDLKDLDITIKKTLGEIARGHRFSRAKPFQRQQGLMLLGGEPGLLGGVLAENQKMPQ